MRNLTLFFSLLISGCQSPNILFKEYKSLPKHVVRNATVKYDIEDNKYSLIIFTSGFNGENLLVENDSKVLLDTTITSIRTLGLATALKINNNYDVYIWDKSKTDFYFKLKKRHSKEHKYIYIKKNGETMKKPFTIIYSNTLRGFK